MANFFDMAQYLLLPLLYVDLTFKVSAKVICWLTFKDLARLFFQRFLSPSFPPWLTLRHVVQGGTFSSVLYSLVGNCPGILRPHISSDPPHKI